MFGDNDVAVKKPKIRSLKEAPTNAPVTKTESKSRTKRKVPSWLYFMGKPFRFIYKYLVPRYFKNSFAELKLVTWPKRKETRQLTTAVVLFAIVLGTLVTTVDYGLDKLFKKVILKQ